MATDATVSIKYNDAFPAWGRGDEEGDDNKEHLLCIRNSQVIQTRRVSSFLSTSITLERGITVNYIMRIL